MTTDNLPPLPRYAYGRECAPNERVFSESATIEYGRACAQAALSTAPVQGLTEALASIIATYDAYRRRGVTPPPVEYADVVRAIEAARAALAAAPHTATPVVHPTGVRVIGMLRQAMINAEVPFELRAAVIGHFCNEWNADAAATASDADSMQGSQPKESRDDTR